MFEDLPKFVRENLLMFILSLFVMFLVLWIIIFMDLYVWKIPSTRDIMFTQKYNSWIEEYG